MVSKKIVLIGATGFIGKQVLNDLFYSGHNVTIVLRKPNKNSLKLSVNTLSLKQLVKSRDKYDCIVNCAGYYSKSSKFLELIKIYRGNYSLIKKLIKFQSRTGGSLITFGSYFEHQSSWKNNPAKHYIRYKIKARKILETYAKKIPFPLFYIYLFDTYGEEDNRNKVLSFIINEFKEGRDPRLLNSLEYINWTHKDDISDSIIRLVDNNHKFTPYNLHEFQIRSRDEFKLRDFVNIIKVRHEHQIDRLNTESRIYKLSDCAPNLVYFEAKNRVIDFTVNMIQKN